MVINLNKLILTTINLSQYFSNKFKRQVTMEELVDLEAFMILSIKNKFLELLTDIQETTKFIFHSKHTSITNALFHDLCDITNRVNTTTEMQKVENKLRSCLLFLYNDEI